MATFLTPSTSIRLNPISIRLLSFYLKNPHPKSLPIHSNNNNCFMPFCTAISSSSSSAAADRAVVEEFRKRLKVAEIKGGADEGLGRLGESLTVKGWVRTVRVQSSVTFIEINDGSCLSNIQCVVDSGAEGYDQVESGLVLTGASICVQGIVVPSQGSKQKIELKVQKLVTVGGCDPSFPIQKKRVSREFLRSKAHLRPRTNTFGAVARVRNALAFATHNFFQKNGFVWISSPIITASDCEGAGEQFCVTTLIPSSSEAVESPVSAIPQTEKGLIDWSQFIGHWLLRFFWETSLLDCLWSTQC